MKGVLNFHGTPAALLKNICSHEGGKKHPPFPAFLLNFISCCHCVSINNERQNWTAPFLAVFPWPNDEMSFYLVDKHMKDILSWWWTLTFVLLFGRVSVCDCIERHVLTIVLFLLFSATHTHTAHRLFSELLISWLEPDLLELWVKIGTATAVQRM